MVERISNASRVRIATGAAGGSLLGMYFMSTKAKIITLGLILLAIFAWLTLGQTPINPVSAATKPKPVKSTSAKVALPVALAVPVHANTAQSADALTPGTQAPVELVTAIDDIASLLQSGNVYSVRVKYGLPDRVARMRADLTPDELARTANDMSALSDLHTRVSIAGVYQAIREMEPVMNEAGDEATYEVTVAPYIPPYLPPGSKLGPAALAHQAEEQVTPVTLTVVFQKIDGKWYLKDGPDALFW
jgi:hypothetical protein